MQILNGNGKKHQITNPDEWALGTIITEKLFVMISLLWRNNCTVVFISSQNSRKRSISIYQYIERNSNIFCVKQRCWNSAFTIKLEYK
jgi:hypothetical protein